MATRIVIVAVTLAVIVLLPHAARRATLAEYMPHSAGSESVRASWYNRPVVDPNAKPEAAVDQDEAIREEIRAKLRTPTGEKVDAPMRRLVATRPQDIAALRLLSSCG